MKKKDLPSINNINSVWIGICDFTTHEVCESSQIGSYGRNAQNSTFSWSITPRLVVGRKHSQMTTTNKFIVIQRKNWTCCIQKFGMINDLNKRKSKNSFLVCLERVLSFWAFELLNKRTQCLQEKLVSEVNEKRLSNQKTNKYLHFVFFSIEQFTSTQVVKNF